MRSRVGQKTRFTFPERGKRDEMSHAAIIQKVPEEGIAYGVYDLAVSPADHAIFNFLACCGAFRVARRLARIHVLIVLPERSSISVEAWHELEHKALSFLQPASELLLTNIGTSVFYNRAEAERFIRTLPQRSIFPDNYSVSSPTSFHSMEQVKALYSRLLPLGQFSATESSKRHVERWIRTWGIRTPTVSLTLPTTGNKKKDEQQFEIWAAFADFLKTQKMEPVFLPEGSGKSEIAELAAKARYRVYDPADIMLDLRAAFYQRSRLNILTGTGSAWINFFLSNSRFIYIVGLKANASKKERDHLTQPLGVEWGESPAFTPGAGFLWLEGTLENIIAGFEEMTQLERNSDEGRGV